jgi:hypothetical protein
LTELDFAEAADQLQIRIATELGVPPRYLREPDVTPPYWVRYLGWQSGVLHAIGREAGALVSWVPASGMSERDDAAWLDGFAAGVMDYENPE